MQLSLVDAFAAGPFTGNPAAVCVVEKPRADAWMQAFAAEMAQSETAYLEQRGDAWHLRWFTPQVEVQFCGHATVASAHVLWESGRASGAISFHTRAGVLVCTRGDDGRIALDVPLVPMQGVTPPEDIDVWLGARLIGAWQAGSDLIVEVDDAATVRSLRPDLRAMAEAPVRGVLVTAAGDDGVHDCVSRFFAPAVGINEDPATGSVHAAVGPFWAKRLRRSQICAFQASARGGRIDIHLNADDANRVTLLGRAVTVMRGEVVAHGQ
jgi:PhzF family phenazine biosynthesis protein